MLKRHVEYKEAALKLKGAHVNNEAVACYYYSVLHRMMYALVNDPAEHKSYDDFAPIGKGTGDKVKEFILNTGKFRGNVKEAFKSDFEDLKDMRKKADYSPEAITDDELLECEDMHRRLMAKLRNGFPDPNI